MKIDFWIQFQGAQGELEEKGKEKGGREMAGYHLSAISRSSGTMIRPDSLPYGILDSIGGRDYPLVVMGSGDSTLNGSVSRIKRKSKSLCQAVLTLKERVMIRKGNMYYIEEDKDGNQIINRYTVT